jgi:ribosomal-protein-alanine N-acetyltransferase
MPEDAPLPYIVEPMSLADLDQVMQIEQVAFSAPWSRRAYRYEVVENEHSTMLVVRPAPAANSLLHRLARRLQIHNLGRGPGPSPVLGYGGFWLLVDDAHIATIAVHPQWRGRGLGELLLLALIGAAENQGAIRATLEVRYSNKAAQGLYHKLGFKITSRRKRYYADNGEDAYLMATPLFSTPGFRDNLRRCRSQLHALLRGDDMQPLQDVSG